MAGDSFTDLDIQDRVVTGRDESTVYRARQRSSERQLALRLVSDSVTSEEGQRLRKEIELLTQVKDSHVVEVCGAAVQQDRLFCVTEWLDGEDLETQFLKGYRFTTEEILHIAEGMTKALRAAARHGVLHYDLRPANVVLTPRGGVKVANFGALGHPRPLVGEATPLPRTVAYLSPEQGMGELLDVRSSIYSLGAVLYELATGRPPFEGYDSTTSLLYQLVHVEPLPPRQIGSSLPKEFERIILRCLAKAPEDRYADPGDVLEDLQQFRASLQSSKHAPVPADDDTGDFDIYEDQPIGEGGMGSLYRGRQRSLDRAVAIKVIREAFITHPEFVQRFRREAELLAQVDNPNVVQVFGTGVWRGRLFYAMEMVKGEDLAARHKRAYKFTHEDLLHIADGVANALRAVWRYKIVHRDIKPSNILITHDGTIKVVDFGLAKSLRIAGAESRVIAGTPEYLSPEQGLGQAVDIRSDIYSLGVILYELSAGKHPFRDAGSSMALIYQHVHTEPKPLEALAGHVPGPLRDLIHRCLQKKPENRYQTPDQLIREIQAVQKRLQSPGDVDPSSRRVWSRKSRALAAGAAAVIALACVSFFLRDSVERPPARPDAGAFRGAYELALGLGDYAEALRLAEQFAGKDSPEYRAAQERHVDQQVRQCEQKARDRVAARDWKGAAQAYEEMKEIAPGARTAGTEAALLFCRDMAEAREKEARNDWSGALALYRKHAQVPTPQREFLDERIRELQGKPEKAPPR